MKGEERVLEGAIYRGGGSRKSPGMSWNETRQGPCRVRHAVKRGKGGWPILHTTNARYGENWPRAHGRLLKAVVLDKCLAQATFQR